MRAFGSTPLPTPSGVCLTPPQRHQRETVCYHLSMTWLTLAVSGMLIWSCTAVVDRFALHGRINSQRFYVVIPALLQLLLVLILYPYFTPTSFEATTVAVGIGGGLVEGFFLYYLFKGMSEAELGRVFPLASTSAILTLLGGYLLFSEQLSSNDLSAFLALVLGGVVLSVEKKRDGLSYKLVSLKALKPLAIGAVFISSYTLALRYTFIESDFATGFFFSRVGFFLFGLTTLLIWRHEIINQWRITTFKIKSVVIGNQLAAFFGHVLYFSAVAMTSAALVQSVLSVQALIVFILAILVSYINPNLVAESITRHDFLQKSIGVILVVIALFLIAS